MIAARWRRWRGAGVDRLHRAALRAFDLSPRRRVRHAQHPLAGRTGELDGGRRSGSSFRIRTVVAHQLSRRMREFAVRDSFAAGGGVGSSAGGVGAVVAAGGAVGGGVGGGFF